ncbi:hypothetical protein F9C07_2229464 [Aspergillus flavus]|uniref:Uncharacterized protein n=1 Tax=Aspergillus flavus (strain ATCC 200026 / FGSC A1120 / IAM 13836 / NRRL 3357 / JCM 12722 / SRRC 167) TaxID=332952 RepID=A0A7U2R204_ASPFN|nr:hypothetical protein F9C07_2229464 [Aspergillus flavus]
MNAARALLDEEHESLPPKPTDDNSYLLGRKNGHNVVIGYPGSGLYGPHNASHVATNMVRTFPISGLGCWLESVVERREPPMLRIRGMAFDWEMLLLVIRRGVMVRRGVLHYDADKFKDNGVFHITSHLNRPPSLLLTATQKLLSDHDSELGQMGNYISQVCSRLARLPALRASRFPGWDRDQLFISSYKHTGEGDCSKWDRAYLVKRLDRESDIPVVHYGLIASGSAVMRSAQRQDQLRDEWDNKEWEPYAAITAAAYAKDLLRVIHPETVEGTANVVGSLNDVSRALDKGDLEVSQLTTSVDKIHEEQKNTNILERLHLHDFNAEQSEASSESREVTGEWLLVLVGKRKCTGFSP